MDSLPPFLLVHDPVAGRSVVRLGASDRVTLGRAPTNRIVLHDERASRFHAEIFPVTGGWAVRDLESRNGTLIGGEPLTADRTLAAGDVISVGHVEIVYGLGEPATDATAAGTSAADTPTGGPSVGQRDWRASITHRRARGRLLDDIGTSAGSVPRVGRAAAGLCRLAFALARADAPRAIAALALQSAFEGTSAARGLVLLPPRIGEAAGGTELDIAAAFPEPWPAVVPFAAATAVLAADEGLLAAAETGTLASIAAPIRCHGKPTGVMYLDIGGHDPASADDLEFVLAVCDAAGLAIDNLAAREQLSTKLATAADENERLRRRLGEETRIIGSSPGLRAILDQVQKVAATKATVLVRGESGTGKELVARSIHDASDRRGGPFVCLNCAALTETLLESELFGHEKGAFTGATERKIGKFEAAHRGTLVLDEIGEMSQAIQAKFLRVLEGHPFERVGGSGRVQVDVRVVAATNRDLERAVAAGDFRRDLYFRLKVVEILVPPLRRRPEDVEAIAGHFLTRFAGETGRKFRGFTPDAMDALRAYHWPGNIRELRNVVERAVVLATGDWIDVADVSLSHLAAPGDTDKQGAPRGGPFVPATIEEVERRHVLATLEAVGGNKTKAAAILGIERSTLDRKLAKWARA